MQCVAVLYAVCNSIRAKEAEKDALLVLILL